MNEYIPTVNSPLMLLKRRPSIRLDLYKIHFFLCFLFVFFQLQAQPSKRANIWYFGQGVGLDFNYSPPKTLINVHSMRPLEACATICDTSGNILLYTDGLTVWNGKNKILKNGTNLKGLESSAQGALFVPHPGNDSFYYLFHAGGDEDDFYFDLINIYSDSIGKVVEKKKRLLFTQFGQGEEKLTAINHANGRDVWVITHKMETDEYYSYLITMHGIIDCPIVSKAGRTTQPLGEQQGYISITTDGKWLINPFELNGVVDICTFNNNSGRIEYFNNITGFDLPFSTCFSPDNNKIYIDELSGYKYQFDFRKKNIDTIVKSKYLMYNKKVRNDEAMYRAPDGTIVINHSDSFGTMKIATIAYPNNGLSFCNFQKYSNYFFNGKDLVLGLPNFNQSYFYHPTLELYYEYEAPSGKLKLKPYDTLGPGWTGTLSIKNIRTADSIFFIKRSDTTVYIKDTGIYRISYKLVKGTDTFYISKTIDNTVIVKPDFLGKDSVVCPLKPFDIVLEAPRGMHCYLWNNGKKSDTIHVNKPGRYAVLVTLPSMHQVWDTIEIKAMGKKVKPSITQTHDSLVVKNGTAPYLWFYNGVYQNSGNLPYRKIASNGIWKVESKDSAGCFTISDSLSVSNLSAQQVFQHTGNIRFLNNTWYLQPEIETAGIQIFNVAGSRIFNGTGLQLYDFKPSNGVYYLYINTQNPSNQIFQKIIITQ